MVLRALPSPKFTRVGIFACARLLALAFGRYYISSAVVTNGLEQIDEMLHDTVLIVPGDGGPTSWSASD